jgi:hypothetical protein
MAHFDSFRLEQVAFQRQAQCRGFTEQPRHVLEEMHDLGRSIDLRFQEKCRRAATARFQGVRAREIVDYGKRAMQSDWRRALDRQAARRII